MKQPIQAFLAATASFIAITILYVIMYFICKSRKKNTTPTTTWTARSISNKHTTTRTGNSSIDESTFFDPSLRIKFTELLEATGNFSPELIVGDGSFGYVYKARLNNGLTVAIKKLDPNAFQGFREFRAEMETLGKLDHLNIVKLKGYCTKDCERLLVYEYMEKGSLDQWLYDSSSSDFDLSASYHSLGGIGPSFQRLPLSWSTRTRITKEIASGLAYIHGLTTPIIHRDIKASNVLLDKEFGAHISDFGLARKIDASHSHVSTQVAGTMGYMPPEYREGMTAATVLADVYSFGILMFEIGTGRRPNLPVPKEGSQVCLIDWARDMVEHKKELEMVDSNISKKDLDEEKVREYFRIASVCTKENPKDRPSMAQVIELLKNVSS